jgi:hypothetical protein
MVNIYNNNTRRRAVYNMFITLCRPHKLYTVLCIIYIRVYSAAVRSFNPHQHFRSRRIFSDRNKNGPTTTDERTLLQQQQQQQRRQQ